MIRYCETCDEEFQPHVAACSDCGGELVDVDENAPAAGRDASDDETAPGAGAVPSDHQIVLTQIHPSLADRIGRRLEAREIDFRLGQPAATGRPAAGGGGLQLSVRTDQIPTAQAVLVRMGAIPPQSGAASEAVAATGGACPACESAVEPGSTECADCGLSLGAEVETCPGCEREIPSGEPCPECG